MQNDTEHEPKVSSIGSYICRKGDNVGDDADAQRHRTFQGTSSARRAKVAEDKYKTEMAA